MTTKEFTANQFEKFLANVWPFMPKKIKEDTTVDFPDGRSFNATKDMEKIYLTMKAEKISKVVLRIPT